LQPYCCNIDYHTNDDELPVELSIPMKWNQPSQESSESSCASSMNFGKPSHDDVPEASKSTGHSTFDPRHTENHTLQKGRLQ